MNYYVLLAAILISCISFGSSLTSLYNKPTEFKLYVVLIDLSIVCITILYANKLIFQGL